MEGLRELMDLVLEWSFLPVALSVALLVTVGTGLWPTRWKRTAWIAGLIMMAVAFYFGIQRHEWGEVLFNGQLL